MADYATKLFTGHERDKESGLDYMLARYYSGELGRMQTVDPVPAIRRAMRESQGWNLYSYGGNNPLTIVDPSGTTIKYTTAFRTRYKTNKTFRKAFKAWKQTPAGKAQWRTMAYDANTNYTLNVGRVEYTKPNLTTDTAKGRTLPIAKAQDENTNGKLDYENVTMDINVTEVLLHEPPEEWAGSIAKVLFEEATHGLDIGSSTKSAKEAWGAERLFENAEHPGMMQFEKELPLALAATKED